MKKYKVEWYEEVAKMYSTEVIANSVEEAKLLIDKDIDEARTGVIEEDHEEAIDWEIQAVREIHEK